MPTAIFTNINDRLLNEDNHKNLLDNASRDTGTTTAESNATHHNDHHRLTYPVATSAPDVCVQRVLSEDEALSVEAAAGELGPDPGSGTIFIKRQRNLIFVLRAGNRWLLVQQNFLNVARDYNRSMGGYRRYFRGMPETFLEDPDVLKLLNKFAEFYGIPDGQIMLLFIQTYVVTHENEGMCTTGQGIHCDGVDVCMMSVLRRDNIAGARNAAFDDIYGKRVRLEPQVLQPGECLFWRDNRVYHDVEPARLMDPSKPGYRTVLVIGYPGIHQVIGIRNPNNTLPPSGLHPPYVHISSEKASLLLADADESESDSALRQTVEHHAPRAL
ncbi:hypothetical protein ACA910_008810 [Epithemia clementina (nom. ined.)]